MADYHNVISKVPTKDGAELYKVGDTYYLLFKDADSELYAFFEYTDIGGPNIGQSIEFQNDAGEFVYDLTIQDGSGIFTEDFVKRGINLGKMNQLPQGYLNQRAFDPFEIMNINAEKFMQKWGRYFAPEYDEVLDIIFQAALNGTEISRQSIQDVLPPGQDFNFRLVDYTNAKLTGPGALAAWEASQDDILDTVLEEYAGNFKFDNPEIYNNLRIMWNQGQILNEAMLNRIVEKMFMDTDYGDDFNTYFDSIKGDIYGQNNPATIDLTMNFSDVSTDVDNYIGGAIAKNIKNDKDKMKRWQNMYNTDDGKAKALEEMQAIWDAGAPDELKGSTAYNQYLYFQQATLSTQGQQFDIGHGEFDEYKYLSYADMLQLGRTKGLKEGNDFTEGLVAEALSEKVVAPRFGEKY